MFYSQYKIWPEPTDCNIVTKPQLLLLHLRALKFNANAYMELPIHDYSEEELAQLMNVLSEKKKSLDSYAMNEPERFWHFLKHLFPQNPELIAAYDIMGWDIWAQLYKSSFQNLIRLPKKSTIHFQQVTPLINFNENGVIELAKSLQGDEILLTVKDHKTILKSFEKYKDVQIWFQPTKELLNHPEQLKNLNITGIILNPLLIEGFTPMIETLMQLRKLNIQVGLYLIRGSILGATITAQFAPILQKIFFPEKIYELPVTGIELKDLSISFPNAAGMGIAFVENFW